MAKSVENLGHQIDAEGLHTTSAKVDAVVQAPEPSNIQELRSFLGLLNYYGKFLPNLATTLHPLNNLLYKRESNGNGHQSVKKPFRKPKQKLCHPVF